MATFPPMFRRAKAEVGTHAHPYAAWAEDAVATDVAPRHRADVEREDGAA